MLTVAACLWQPNDKSHWFSKCYDETWVIKLYKGYERNLTVPWRFVLFCDRDYDLPGFIKQERIRQNPVDYGAMIEPFRFGTPMILTGLDTIIVGSISHLADYCMTARKVALPRDPNRTHVACNGVALIPAGQQHIYRNWRGENDMEWLRRQDHAFIDDLFPQQVVSYKLHVKKNGLGDARIVYFHGDEKPHQLDLDWVKQHWTI